MQKRARQHVFAGFFELLAAGVPGAHRDTLGPPHLLAKTRDAEAALLALTAFPRCERSLD